MVNIRTLPNGDKEVEVTHNGVKEWRAVTGWLLGQPVPEVRENERARQTIDGEIVIVDQGDR